ncbi:hypothetical protein D9611_001096 [Ephemerocybe angulata]|uniref:Oxidase ustYa n=1 Tax=Ephemerocybe angulata TaxID=980116 RepID=A0A8H5CHL4_9AGAR|nr:hypothetical protein D9611_001096 [Tulosesus angulatus]
MKYDTGSVHAVMLVAIVILTACNAARFALNLSYIDIINKAVNSLHFQKSGTPRLLPIPLQDAVMVFQSTERYGLDKQAEWESITPTPVGGWIKLPVPHRSESTDNTNMAFSVAMYHQIHCLDLIRYDLLQSRNATGAFKLHSGHADHCYNYVRKGLLCGSDTTLEPWIAEAIACDANTANIPTEAPRVAHVCKDWTQIRRFVGPNYHDNVDYINRAIAGKV